MIKVRKSQDRGHVNLGWLDTKHSFSFSSYYDPNHMGFESLRVINDDLIAPSKGFSTHPHKNMEIITYVTKGALKHQDSMNNSSVIKAGDVQRMSAGTGVTHSEFNYLDDQETKLLQIWFLPEKQNIEPSYEQKHFSNDEKKSNFKLLASKNGKNGSISLNQDVNMSAAILEKNEEISYKLENSRKAWVQIVKGEVTLNQENLKEGDGAKIEDEKILTFKSLKNSEIIIFDMKPLNN